MTKTEAEARAAEEIEAETEQALADPEEVAAATPEPTELVVRDAEDVFRRMSLEDERQIMDELQGRALEVMIYSFEIDGKRQTGFSWKGIREAVRTLNSRGWTEIKMAKEIKPEFEAFLDEEGEEAIRCVVYAEDTKNGGGNWGVAVAKQFMKRRSGTAKPDPFATHKALSKAQRNAFEPLIPIEAVEYLKAQYHGQQAVKVIPGAGQAIEIERPPALTDEAAVEKIDRLRAIYDEIKEVERLAMVPGQFNSIIMGAQHDHDRLDEAIAHLESFRDTEREIAVEREAFRGKVAREVFEREVGKMLGLSQQRRLARFRDLVEQASKQ